MKREMLRERERGVLKIDLWLIAISRVSRQAPLFKKKLICVTPVLNLRRIFQISLSRVGMNGVGVQKRFLTSVYIFGFFRLESFRNEKTNTPESRSSTATGFKTIGKMEKQVEDDFFRENNKNFEDGQKSRRRLDVEITEETSH